MPFKSDKQRRFLFAEKPDVAAKFVRDSKSTGGKMEKHKKQCQAHESNEDCNKKTFKAAQKL